MQDNRVHIQKDSELISFKNGIISKISHEYRTPLTVIQTSTDLLKIFYKMRDDEKFDESIRKINSSIEKMVKILEDIVLLGEIESKMIELDYQNIDVISYIDSIISHHKTSIPDIQEIIFITNGEKRHFVVDLYLINIIIKRLLFNAINYSDNNSQIHITLNTYTDYFDFSIEDNGEGIEPEKLEVIFNPYKKFNKNENSVGSGFSLAIVKESVNILSGSLDIKSKRGEGTRVIVKIPDRK